MTFFFSKSISQTAVQEQKVTRSLLLYLFVVVVVVVVAAPIVVVGLIYTPSIST